MSETICSHLNEQFYTVYRINSSGEVILKYYSYEGKNSWIYE